MACTKDAKIIYELSQKLIEVQRPIRILDAINWDDSVRDTFFKHQAKRLPVINLSNYKPLTFKPADKILELEALELEIKNKLGTLSGLSHILIRMCEEYRLVVRMLESRGTVNFTKFSQALYGSSGDAFYVGGPTIVDLATILEQTLPALQKQIKTSADEKIYTSVQAMEQLNARLSQYFDHQKEIAIVQISDQIIADAAAGAEVIKLRKDAMFSERDIRLLEVHEGWVHLGTTLNGLRQPICTFLSKGPPSSTITQEGLAVITEIFTFSSYPARLQRLARRIVAIQMVEQGANFLEIYRYFKDKGHTDEDSYALSLRIFRGSLPENAGPFTKDLAYNKGFVQIYNYIRLAIKYGVLEQIPLLFLGKTTLQDLPLLVDLLAENIVVKPFFLPPQFRDLAALSSWMSYSLFMNRLDLDQMAMDYKAILRL